MITVFPINAWHVQPDLEVIPVQIQDMGGNLKQRGSDPKYAYYYGDAANSKVTRYNAADLFETEAEALIEAVYRAGHHALAMENGMFAVNALAKRHNERIEHLSAPPSETNAEMAKAGAP